MIAYRFLTEDDTAAFCHKITKALNEGWVLYGNPTMTFDDTTGKVRCGQAVTKEADGAYSPEMRLGSL